MITRLLITFLLALVGLHGYSQCSLLSTTISVDFSADGTCAPVTVNTFTVTYTFNAPQNPADIEIQFIWNDPANTTETVAGAGLTVSNGDRTYQATATPYSYPDTGPECFFEAQAFIIVAGDMCETSEQTQIVPSWNLDDENGGVIAFDPGQYNLCENTELVNVIFDDASTFNCNINDNPDNPNQISRWVQFVYGSDPAPAVGRLRDVTLDDGGIVTVTDNAGNLNTPQTRGTGAVMITAGYFGPVEEVPFPADEPIHSTFPLSAPANAANIIGTTFEVTLFNWNTCNPYNGDPIDPNYEDAVSETLIIEIIPPPNPSYIAREDGPGGATPAEFCINSNIYFDNQTAGGPFTYFWQFFDGPADSDPLAGTSNAENPTFAFNSGGDKLVRLTASDANADGVCDVVYEDIVTLSPDAVANFDFYDASFTSIIDPNYCQTGTDVFTVGFRDNTVDQPNTEFRFEFYDESNALISTQPTDGSFLPDPVPDFTRDFSVESFTIVRLVAINTSTLCGSEAQDTVFVYGRPQPDFNTIAVCEGSRTTFSAISDPIGSLTTQVNNDEVNLYEWDFSYDGTFNVELVQTDNTNFDWYLDGTNIFTGVEPGSSIAGTYTVALRTTTEKGGCSDIITQTVTINDNPDAQLSHDATSDICPNETIIFTNNSSNPTLPGTTYQLEVTHPPSGFVSSVTLTDTNTPLSFDNPDDTTRTYQAQIRAETTEGCFTLSSTETFRVSPNEEAAFDDPTYNFFNTNCSPWNSTMIVDPSTQALAPDLYRWTLMDINGAIAGYPIVKNSGDIDFHELDYEILNTSATIMNYAMVLEVDKTGICISNDTFNIQISPQPSAAFTINRTDECDQVVLAFEATQKGLSNYNWNFDPTPNQMTGGDDEIQVLYNREPNAGNDINLEITLVTTNLASCQSNPEIVNETVEKLRPAAVVDFILSSTTLQLPDSTVSITNNSTTGTGITYEWDFGDGNTFSGFNPGSHSYNQFGTFEITLELTDEFCTTESSQTVTVLPADPILDFQADTLEGCAPLTVQFTNLSQFAVSGQYVWEFGDGSISRSDNPTHTFFASGDFTIRLRGENVVGENSEIEKEQYISVYARPFADFLVSTRVLYIPDQEAIFKNLSENASTYIWDFGDGTTSTDSDPRHAYTEEGFYDITLIATNDLGCVDTLFRSAEVEAVSGGQVETPNAFTPNLNGPSGGVVNGTNDPSSINDVFLPRLEGVERFRMFIYNKWGELIFESSSQNKGWDGYYKSKLAPSGVYVYKLEIRYSDGRDDVKVGDVTLIR
ncbi:PKD domain-containing protein [Ekhidna sp.]|uniref:PKD domain-containing protein n=1 Tax=Ekhidna sp. TaxID=2608089 RepID=UPI003B5028F5